MKHLKEVDMTYLAHLWLALQNSLKLFIASITLFIHALVPAFFTKTTSKMIDGIQRSFPKNNQDRILVRFNTKWKEDPQNRHWRVLVNGNETLAEKVTIKTNSDTIEEEVAGEQKFHFLCFGKVLWQNNNAEII